MTRLLLRFMDVCRRSYGWCRLRRLDAAGIDVRLGRSVLLSHPGRIRLGDRTCLARNVALRANSDARHAVSIGADCTLQDGALLNASMGSIEVGDRVWIGPFCVIYGNGQVRIGNDVMIAAHTCITSAGHEHQRLDVPMSRQPLTLAPVTIADDVWIGMHCTILPGVSIGRGAIVAAGAVVNHDVVPFAIVGGVPARVIGNRELPT